MNAPAEKKKQHPKNTLDSRVVKLETGFDYLATKADLANLRGDLKNDIANVRTELSNVESRLNDRIADVEKNLTDKIYNVSYLLFGALIAAVLGLAGLMAKGFHWI